MDRYIGEKELAAFERHLRREEREAGTIEKYLRDVRALAAWLDGRAVDKGLAVAWKERGTRRPRSTPWWWRPTSFSGSSGGRGCG